MKTITPILEKILFFLIILIMLLSACVFNFYIQKQSELDMDELNKMVEKEMQEAHGN
jgi:hypothetical protein